METKADPWSVLCVHSRREREVLESLRRNGVEALAPHAKMQRQYSDRTVTIERPMLPGYCLARFDSSVRTEILQATPFHHGFLAFAGADAAVPHVEVERLCRMVDESLELEGWPRLVVGEPVRIVKGSLAGMDGILAKIKGRLHVAVNLNMLGRSVSTTIERWMVEAA